MKQGTYIILGVLMLGTAFYLYNKNKKGSGNTNNQADEDNFNQLQQNIGLKAGTTNVVVAPFNSKKNHAQFYNNHRVIFFNDKNLIVVKGAYSNGGKTITLDNGTEFSSNSVWKNMQDVIDYKNV